MPKEKENLYPMRINKYLALKKISTRREADELIREKKVFINGKLAVLGSKLEEKDKVEIKGAKLKEYAYFAFNKPVGIETTALSGVPPKAVTGSPKADLARLAHRATPEGKAMAEGLFPLGRLDKNSHGLLIITNDGRITDRLLSPKYSHEKEYIVRTSNKLRSSFKQKMEAGVNIEGYKTKKCKVQIINDFTFKVTLTEGKKHQIRRMCSALFQEVADLKRERIMNIKLGNLKPNSLREIKGEELAIFLRSIYK